jgi:hypothetical protein
MHPQKSTSALVKDESDSRFVPGLASLIELSFTYTLGLRQVKIVATAADVDFVTAVERPFSAAKLGKRKSPCVSCSSAAVERCARPVDIERGPIGVAGEILARKVPVAPARSPAVSA